MKSKIFILAISCLALFIVLFSCKKKEPADFIIEWTFVTDSAPWSYRYDHSTVVFDNEIWVLGGYHENDVWRGEIVDGVR